MEKVSSQFRKGNEGELDAWTWLGTVLGKCGLSDTMPEWELTKEEFNSENFRYVFTRRSPGETTS
jgi:hypothetical protein